MKLHDLPPAAAATVIVKSCVAVAPAASAASSCTATSPTSPLAGVPVRVAVPSWLSVSVSQAGSAGAVSVTVSAVFWSLVVTP